MWELNIKTDTDNDKGNCPYSTDPEESRKEVLQWINNILKYYKEENTWRKINLFFFFIFEKYSLSSKNYKKVKIVKNSENKQNYHKYPYKFFLFSLQYQFSGVFQAQ